MLFAKCFNAVNKRLMQSRNAIASFIDNGFVPYLAKFKADRCGGKEDLSGILYFEGDLIAKLSAHVSILVTPKCHVAQATPHLRN